MKYFKILNPKYFIGISNKLQPWFISSFFLFFILGLYYALFASPADYQQLETVRIMYIHVPCAWLSLMIYFLMGILSISVLVWRAHFGFIVILAAAPIGASFALLTLITGAIWGKPIWGTWWVWDARLTSMLILFIFYLSFIIIANASPNIDKVEKPACVIALLGAINVPIVKFSVNLWYSLHQPASILRLEGSAIDKSMLLPLGLMFVANGFLFLTLLQWRVKIIMTKNRRGNDLYSNR